MKPGLPLYLSLIATAFLCGCNSSSHPQILPFTNYAGSWDVRWNSILDECELIEGGGQGLTVTDQHQVTQNGDSFTVTTETLATDEYTGSLDSDNRLVTSATLEGNLFGDGIFCQVLEDLSYNNFDGTRADLYYSSRIVCADGFRCDSVMRGTGSPQRS